MCLIHRTCDSRQIGRLQVLDRSLHLDLEVLQWSKFLSKFGVHKMRQKPPANRTFALYLGTGTDSHKKQQPSKFRDALDGVCDGSGAHDSSRRQPDATHEVFQWTRSCESAAQKSPMIQKIIVIHAREPSTGNTPSTEKQLLPRDCCSPGG